MTSPEGLDIEVLAKLADVQVEDPTILRADLARLMQLVERLQAVETGDAPRLDAAPTRRMDQARTGRGRAVLAEAANLERDHIVVDKR